MILRVSNADEKRLLRLFSEEFPLRPCLRIATIE